VGDKRPPGDLYGEGHGIDVVKANDFVNKLARDEDEVLLTIRKYCRQMDLPNINPEEGRALQMLAQMAGAKRALEVGTCTGYSAIWIARGLAPDGLLETIEMDESRAKLSEDNFRKAGVDKKVKVLRGKALQVMEKLPEKQYDFIFIDAEKTEYSDYLREALRLSHKGTVICADNMFALGKLFEDGVDDYTEGVKEFQKRLFSNQRLKSTILPLSDGVSWSIVRS
jgi:predicted O-methyltransferase YrrM